LDSSKKRDGGGRKKIKHKTKGISRMGSRGTKGGIVSHEKSHPGFVGGRGGGQGESPKICVILDKRMYSRRQDCGLQKLDQRKVGTEKC